MMERDFSEEGVLPEEEEVNAKYSTWFRQIAGKYVPDAYLIHDQLHKFTLAHPNERERIESRKKTAHEGIRRCQEDFRDSMGNLASQTEKADLDPRIQRLVGLIYKASEFEWTDREKMHRFYRGANIAVSIIEKIAKKYRDRNM